MPAGSSAASATAPVYPQPGSDAEPLRPAPRAGIPLDNEEFGIDCRLCRTRLYVRRSQIGDTVKCPDCHSPVVVTAPPMRKRSEPTEYDEEELSKLSAPVELPSTLYLPPGTSTEGSVPGVPSASGRPMAAGSAAGGGTAMQVAARTLLEEV